MNDFNTNTPINASIRDTSAVRVAESNFSNGFYMEPFIFLNVNRSIYDTQIHDPYAYMRNLVYLSSIDQIVTTPTKINSFYKLYNDCPNKLCEICFDEFKKDTTICILNCYHYFCMKCYDNIQKVTKNCPFCRKNMIGNDFIESKGMFGNPPLSEHNNKILEIIRYDLFNENDADNDADDDVDKNSNTDNENLFNPMEELD
jgi:hypothetical protein